MGHTLRKVSECVLLNSHSLKIVGLCMSYRLTFASQHMYSLDNFKLTTGRDGWMDGCDGNKERGKEDR